MTKKRESYINFFLRNIKSFSSTLNAFNGLEASCAKYESDLEIVRRNKLTLIDFLNKFVNQIELIFENNTAEQFNLTSEPLLKIQQEISNLDSKYSTALELIASNLDLIIDFMFLTEGDFHCINFPKEDEEKVKQSLSNIKREIQAIQKLPSN